MFPHALFHHCPGCGRKRADGPPLQPFHCVGCGLTYYFNPTVAVAAILLESNGRALFIRRAKEPAKGKLALPGGFVDIGETAEDALRREVREEVGLAVGPLDFLCSRVNQYEYKGVTYPVLDFFFVTRAESTTAAVALDGVESICWLALAQLDFDEIAFPSIRAALQFYLARR